MSSDLLLDTHVLFWWVTGSKRLSRNQREALKSISPKRPAVVAAISLWEVAMLHSLGRVELDVPLRVWLDKATAAPLVRIQDVTPPIATEVASLPDSMSRDPADRLIVATARVLGCSLLTSDDTIRKSGVVRTV